MDIHRCRFVPFPPAAINAAAFSQAPNSALEETPRSLRLALGRANGDVEIWNSSKGNWFQETILRGGRDRSIEGLAWTEYRTDGDSQHGGRLRLFSIGLSSSVTEWDLERGTTLRHANGNYGEIWCFAAQPQHRQTEKVVAGASAVPDASSHAQYLAAGCADGNILLFSTEDGDLRFSKVIGAPPTKKPRVLSITWKNKFVIVAGYSDGTIRLFDIRSRRMIRAMTLGKPSDGSNEILVWSVKCLPDETIVSGDSTGEIKLWDSQNHSLVQRLQAHKADVLDVATSADGEMIISGGADRRTVAFKPIGPKKSGKSRRWAEIMHRRFHAHDVKTLTAFESKDLSVLVSGGLDTVPVVVPLREWQSEYHRSLPNLPRISQVCSAPAARLLVSWWERDVSVWHIEGSGTTTEGGDLAVMPADERYQLVSKILLTGDENITSASISKDGKTLAVATSSSVKAFFLSQKQIAGKPVIKVRTINLPPAFESAGAHLVRLSPDCRWLSAVRPDNTVSLIKIHHFSDSKDRPAVSCSMTVVRLRRRARKLESSGNPFDPSLGKYERKIISLTFSQDSRILAVGDISGCVDSWLLEGSEDLSATTSAHINGHLTDSSSDDSSADSSDDEASGMILEGQQWIHSPSMLPSLGSPVLTLSFRPPKAGVQNRGDGDVGVHATRSTPHPHSHTVPVQEDRLIAVTAQHQLAEFEILQGRLSDWSRRNPAAYLPKPFTVIKDRVMDCFWDVSGDHERLYLYGPSWIFMLEMSKDLPDLEVIGQLGHHEVVKPSESVLGKRKWSTETDTAKKHNTGAGDAMRTFESYVGIGKKMKKYKGSEEPFQEKERVESINLDNQHAARSDDEDDEALRSGLASLRRGAQSKSEVQQGGKLTNGDNEEEDDDDKSEADGAGDGVNKALLDHPGSEQQQEEQRSWWHTFNYRSILGIAPIASSFSSDSYSQPTVSTSTPTSLAETDAATSTTTTTTRPTLEIAIVERPLWDVDLPPRYDE